MTEANMPNADKERIIRLVNRWLKRSDLSIDQVLARVQARGCDISRATFENHFTTRVNQRPNVPPDWTLAVIIAFTEDLTECERCTADEAIEWAILTRLPLDRFEDLRRLFPSSEFLVAYQRYVPIPAASKGTYTTGTSDK
jgi:hypothetical protein